MLIAALLPIYGNNVSINRWIDRDSVVHIYTMKYRSAIKMNEMLSFAATLIDLEDIMPCKSDRERQIMYDTTCMWND